MGGVLALLFPFYLFLAIIFSFEDPEIPGYRPWVKNKNRLLWLLIFETGFM